VVEAADQAIVFWTRRDPPATMPLRNPSTLYLTMNGTSRLPAARAKPVNLGSMNQPADVPLRMPLNVELVTNQGDAPLTVNSVELWEELPAYLPDGGTYDAGGPEGGLLVQCNAASMNNPFSECSRFSWAPMGDPATLLPVTLDGGATPQMPSQQVIGRMFVGCLADGGSCPPAITRYHVYAVVSTLDPYASCVTVPVQAWVRYLP
jgi:hypothetical protein